MAVKSQWREQHMAVKRQWLVAADYGEALRRQARAAIVHDAGSSHPWLQTVLDSENRPVGTGDDDLGEPRGLCI